MLGSEMLATGPPAGCIDRSKRIQSHEWHLGRMRSESLLGDDVGEMAHSTGGVSTRRMQEIDRHHVKNANIKEWATSYTATNHFSKPR